MATRTQQRERRTILRNILAEHPGKTYRELLQMFNDRASFRLQLNSLQGILAKTARREKIDGKNYRYYLKERVNDPNS